jgi:outer membrane protein TolC
MIRRVFVIVFAVLLASSGRAEPLRLTLADAIRLALHGGAQAERARSAEELARVARSEAFGNLLPQVEAQLRRSNQSLNLETFGFTIPGQPPVIGPFNVTDVNLRGAMQLFNLAALRRYEAMQQGVKASRYTTEAAENDVASAVARLYLIAQRAQSQIASREADVALFERLLGVSKDEFKAGTGTRLDVAQANIQLARAKQALLVAQNDQQTAELALLNAIGADESSDVVLVDPLPATQPPPALDAALQTAKANRPELKEVAAREESAKLDVAAARARRVPSVALNFEGDYAGNHADNLLWSRTIAGVLSVPLWRADIPANIARAKIELHDAEIQRAQRERDVEQDVRRSILTLTNAQARVAVATENVTVADEALTVARDRRSAGYGSPVEVDRAQDAYRQAREDLIAAQVDAAAAEMDVRHATGDIRTLIEATVESSR